MSADIMLISKQEDSHFEGKGTDKAVFVSENRDYDDANKFAGWLYDRYGTGYSILEQIAGATGHTWNITITESDVKAVKAEMKNHKFEKEIKKNIANFFERNIGNNISLENW